ncbi:murein biosynthesis integral membrane protein MurJ [Buchnera aphidicola]|uniref:murein biosynthesis integral membrane protein MurJ n=1 Tax=Buchnera aphidicola TaxID=9 RepID=UPI003BEF3094
MNILKSLVSVSIITFLSRILGFFRDVLIAHTFGISIFTDAFFTAFKIPNLLRRIFAEGVFTQSFVPVLVEYKHQKSEKYIQYFISCVFGLMIFLLFILTVLGIFFARNIIMISAPGFSKSLYKLTLATNLLTVMFPYILLISLSSLLSSILHAWNYFSIPSISPIFLNLSMIIFLFFFHSYFHPNIFALAWSVIIGGMIQLFYQLPYLYKINMFVMPIINLKHSGITRVLKKIGSTIIGSSANQISLIINTVFSSLLNVGSISWIYYADRLIEFPIGIFGISLSTILFTSLSKHYHEGIVKKYQQSLDWSIRLSLILGVPSALVCFICAKPLIIILFQYGKFTEYDVLMTQKVLELYSFGLVSFILVKLLSCAFYACEEIHIPMRVSIITIFFTQLINPILIFYFKHAGLALSISLSSWFNFLFLYWKLYQKNLFSFKYNWYIFIFRLFCSSTLMVLILLLMLYIMPSWDIGSICNKIFRLFCILFCSVIVYFSALYFLGLRLFTFLHNIQK